MIIDVNKLTGIELEEARKQITEELGRRQLERKRELTRKFVELWEEMKKTNLVLDISELTTLREGEELATLREVEEFYFSDLNVQVNGSFITISE